MAGATTGELYDIAPLSDALMAAVGANSPSSGMEDTKVAFSAKLDEVSARMLNEHVNPSFGHDVY